MGHLPASYWGGFQQFALAAKWDYFRVDGHSGTIAQVSGVGTLINVGLCGRKGCFRADRIARAGALT